MMSNVSNLAGRFLRTIFNSASERQFKLWFQAQGDKTLRVQYDLAADSIVFDLGGYEGQWSSDIFARYCCRIFVFEPVPAFADGIQRRFQKNPCVRVFPFGLSSVTSTARLRLTGDASSQFKKKGEYVEVQFVKAEDFMNQQQITKIDLMKINIEGGEFDLLEYLLDSGLTTCIRDIQVQFHEFVPKAKKRMRNIHLRLAKTHSLTYQFPFVWENWRNNDDLHSQS